MKCLTTEEVRVWCEGRGLRVTDRGFLVHEPESPYTFCIDLEVEGYRAIGTATLLVPPWEDVPFEGALLWIRERGYSGDFLENTADVIIRRLRLAAGISEPLEKSPGHEFGPDEEYEMYAFLTVPVVFGWDAYLIPKGSNHFVFVSLDGYVRVECRTEEMHRKLLSLAQEFNPRETK